MARRTPPDHAPIDEDALATIVDRQRPVDLDDFADIPTTPGRLASDFEQAAPGGPFEEAETEAQPVGSQLDDSFPEEWPPPDPFGEAKTMAHDRETIARRLAAARDDVDEVPPDEATVVASSESVPTREATTRPKVAPPQPLAAGPALGALASADGPDVEKTIQRPLEALPDLGEPPPTPPPRASLPRREPRPSQSPERLTVVRREVDPEQALGFMTVGLLVGLAMSALVGSLVAGWLFTVR